MNWGECDQRVDQFIKDGGNVVIWFSLTLEKRGGALITSSVAPRCVQESVKRLKKAGLEAEATVTKARQIELDRTAEEFHALHAERQQLVRQAQELDSDRKAKDEEVKRLHDELRRKEGEVVQQMNQFRALEATREIGRAHV